MINVVSQGILNPIRPEWAANYQRERGQREQADSGRDNFKPTPLARRFMQSGLDASSSVTEISKDKLQFNLSYIGSEQEILSASGHYFRKEQSLEINFTYRFHRLVVTKDRQEWKNFELNFSLQAQQVEERSLQPFEEKEDVIEFIRRLANEIMNVSADEKKKLVGVILNKQDIRDIVSLEKGRIAKLLFTLISSVLMLEEMRHTADKKDEAEQVILYPHRMETEGITLDTKTDRQITMNLTLQEISPEIDKPLSVATPSVPNDAETDHENEMIPAEN